jgi:hypothetical protein
VLAAVVLAGGYRKAKAIALGAAFICSTALAGMVLPQVPKSLRALADYGVRWPLQAPPKRSPMTGEAGFNLLAVDGRVEFAVRPRNPGGRTRVEVDLEGVPAEQVVLTEREPEHWFRLAWPHIELVHVELRARDAATGRPAKLLVVVFRRTDGT